MSSLTTTLLESIACCVASRSPASQCQMWFDFFSLSGLTSGASGSSALRGSMTGSSGSYSTSTAAAPSDAA